jgi:hypothetical protein
MGKSDQRPVEYHGNDAMVTTLLRLSKRLSRAKTKTKTKCKMQTQNKPAMPRERTDTSGVDPALANRRLQCAQSTVLHLCTPTTSQWKAALLSMPRLSGEGTPFANCHKFANRSCLQTVAAGATRFRSVQNVAPLALGKVLAFARPFEKKEELLQLHSRVGVQRRVGHHASQREGERRDHRDHVR